MAGDFEIKFTTPLTDVGATGSANNNPNVDNDVKVFNKVSNPISSTPVYTDEDFAKMWLEAGLKPSEAPNASATVAALAPMEAAGLDLVELDEMFADEPDVVAHMFNAYQGGSATRIERQGNTYAALIENLPEGTTEEEFEALMYAINA